MIKASPNIIASGLSFTGLVLTTGTHLAYGASILAYVRQRANMTQDQQLYTRQLPTAAYIFITALLMALYVLMVALCRGFANTCNRNHGMMVILWYWCLIVVVSNFAAGVLTANQYSLFTQVISNFNINISTLGSQFLTYYRLALIDAIFTFVVGLPASGYLFYRQSYKRALMGVQEERERRHKEEMEKAAKRVLRIEEVIVFESELDPQGESST